MQSMLSNLILSHQQLICGVVIGYACAHAGPLAGYLFHKAMLFPPLRAWIVANPDRAKAAIDAIQQELDKDIDAEASANQTPPPQGPAHS